MGLINHHIREFTLEQAWISSFYQVPFVMFKALYSSAMLLLHIDPLFLSFQAT